MFKNLSWSNTKDEGEKKEISVDYRRSPFAPSPMAWPRINPGIKNNFRPAYWEKLENEIIQQAKEKAFFIEKEAYEKGFVQGEKNGWEMAQKKLAVLWDNFQKLFHELEKKLEELYSQNERALIKLALEITKKILQQNHLHLEDTIVKTLSAAWQYVKENKKIIIHLHPKDYEYLMANSPRWPFPYAEKELGKVELVADSTISRGGCYLQTAVGDIDATLETQYDQLVSLIWQKVSKERD
ncbi:MAG: FliH/SctL family protein [Thermodesulfobacteriota bacterium]